MNYEEKARKLRLWKAEDPGRKFSDLAKCIGVDNKVLSQAYNYAKLEEVLDLAIYYIDNGEMNGNSSCM